MSIGNIYNDYKKGLNKLSIADLECLIKKENNYNKIKKYKELIILLKDDYNSTNDSLIIKILISL
jgi:hypothetical protein